MSDELIDRVGRRVAALGQAYRRRFLDGATEFHQSLQLRSDAHDRPICPSLEFHAAHGCNFGCDHCSHYSNYLEGQSVTAADTEKMFAAWHQKLYAPKFKILGGEPLLNPELIDILRLAKRYWTQSRIVLHTNGLLFSRHPELPAVLRDTQIHLFVTMHSKEVGYLRRFEKVLDEIETWNIIFYVAPSINQWRQTTNGVGSAMTPWNSDPQEAWNVCPARYAVQLHENRLWKCPQIAYLPLALRPYGLDQSAEWKPYLGYQSLSADSTDDELRTFLRRESESICSMCSSQIAFVPKDISKRRVA